MYDPLAYAAALLLVELPWLLAQSVVFVPIVYFMIKFRQTVMRLCCLFYLLCASMSRVCLIVSTTCT